MVLLTAVELQVKAAQQACRPPPRLMDERRQPWQVGRCAIRTGPRAGP